jgi:putative addiction module component (TIGR02574 family)
MCHGYCNGMSKFSAADVLELPVSERLELVEYIWNSIAAVPEKLELTEEEKRLIDQRLQARQQNPEDGSSWEEVYARITSRRK